ncbi:MAG: PhzF family phenazine biosynthesis protein [Acidobacteria bacterium]|nr:MAG: PhzF family phenazine biosynthesis protein [Acidobacteriota bacterium]
MKTEIFQIDAFSQQPFGGNPAAVTLMPDYPDDDWMQQVAAEMNLSETAFLRPRDDGFDLRWFTPEVEVELCGHATLASAHFLWERGVVDGSAEISFWTLSGRLAAKRSEEWIELDFPKQGPEEIGPPPELLMALGVDARWVGKNRFDYLIELGSEKEVRAAAPDFGQLRSVAPRGVMITSRAESPNFDFVSRFFAPAVGVDEDPVTGSAHCCLAPFWAERLDRNELLGYQASRRGGVVRTRTTEDRVVLGGQAVTVLRGELEA